MLFFTNRALFRRRPAGPPACAIAVGAICGILRPMHSPRAYRTHSVRLPHAIILTLCGALLFSSALAGNQMVFAQEKPPAGQRPPAKSVDSYTITQRGDGYRVNITYPQVGNAVADAELAIWAREQASAFTEGIRLIPTPPPVPYELFISYETMKVSSRVISVVFFINTSMGGARPEPGMSTFVFDKRYGRRLSSNHLFTVPD